MSYTLLLGFFMYFGLYQVFALPMKVLLQPLSTLSVMWMIAVVIVCMVSLIINMKNWTRYVIKSEMKRWWPMALILCVGILAQIIVITNNVRYGSFADASYYIADSGRSVVTDTIEQYAQYTGVKRGRLDPLYLLLTYTSHNSMLSYISGIHPLIIWRQVMGAVVIIISNLAVYKIGLTILKKEKLAILAWAFWFLVQFFTYSAYAPAGFLFYRAFEGKTILAIVIIPVLLLQMVKSIFGKFENRDFIGSLLVTIGSIPFTMSSMMMVPVVITIFYLPGMIGYKSKRAIWQYALLMGICLIELVCYVLISKGIFNVPVR
ncbi:MAG: hypothetical protein EOM40_08885 [Clostridia bacterium]|nr:hypothetical protein [Clostridia bacterium]NCC43008.1 hypothetical protein [Clostridia bacterium]